LTAIMVGIYNAEAGLSKRGLPALVLRGHDRADSAQPVR
jgi:hypothetical protein